MDYDGHLNDQRSKTKFKYQRSMARVWAVVHARSCNETNRARSSASQASTLQPLPNPSHTARTKRERSLESSPNLGGVRSQYQCNAHLSPSPVRPLAARTRAVTGCPHSLPVQPEVLGPLLARHHRRTGQTYSAFV